MGMPTGPRLPGPTLADTGKGRLLRSRHASVVEERSGDDWRVVSRYGSADDAGVALDELVANGPRADELRVREIGPPLVLRIAAGIFLALLALVLAVAIVLLIFS